MYNIWCEVKKLNIVLIIIGIIMTIISFFDFDIYETISLLIITLALILTFFKSVMKYMSLKKNGVLLSNIPYYFENISNNEKVMFLEFEYQNQKYKLFKKRRNWDNILDNGVTSVIINVKKNKEYYVFLPR